MPDVPGPGNWVTLDAKTSGYLEKHYLPQGEKGHDVDVFCICAPELYRDAKARTLVVKHMPDVRRLEVPDRLPEEL